MKITKRLTVLALAAFLLASFAPLASMAGSDPAPPALPSGYGSFSGTVAEVTDIEEDYALYSVRVESADGDIAVFIVTADSCDITGVRPAVGDKFTGYYDLSLPMLMIWPPQYQAVAFHINLDDKYTVKVARFDVNSDGGNGQLLSDDGELVIHVGEDTVLLQANGEDFIGGAEELAGRALVVLYTVSTRSMPPQTTPEMIFVLYERAVPLPEDFEPYAPASGIMVNGMMIDAHEPYLKGDVLMVPLRAVAEALGYTVNWEAETRSIYLNNVISLSIGKDYYTYARMAPITLGTAPEITDGLTFVPLSFFKEVMRVTYANYLDGVAGISDLSDVPILVNGQEIEGPPAYFKGYTLMVPLRAVAEALGFTVTWEAETQSVYLNNVISLSIGRDYYTYARTAPIELGMAPELTDGLTYVPLSFFTEVAGMNNAYYFEGVIEINSDEPMA